MRYGRLLCESLLEPIVDKYGPISISAGWLPSDLSGGRVTPHVWGSEYGAAVDIVIHRLANMNVAPIKQIAMLADQFGFDRMISYAGSEFICLATGRAQNRRIIYENVRMPPPGPGLVAKPQYLVWPETKRARSKNWPPDRPEWRRVYGEPIYHSRRSLRPQHVRVSKYFTALDFCRDEPAMNAGSPWVPESFSEGIVNILRAAGCFLDPLAERHGFVTITRGVSYGSYAYQVEGITPIKFSFKLPEGETDVGVLVNDPRCLNVSYTGGDEYTVTFTMYQPDKIYSSAVTR
jgi:hypothetical protein